jgi:hypothetical protein
MPGWVIQLSYRIVYCGLLLAILLALACFVFELRHRSFRWLPFYGVALALQPGWHYLTSDELHGRVLRVRADCGYGPRSASILLLATTVALLVIIWRRSPMTRRSFFFWFALVFTVLCFASELILLSGVYAAIPQELYASIFTGFGGRPQDLLVMVVVCVLLFFLQRIHFGKQPNQAMQ